MSIDVQITGERHIRGIDTNSLLRMYDLAQGVLTNSELQQERDKAHRAIQRIAIELRKRNVPIATGR